MWVMLLKLQLSHMYMYKTCVHVHNLSLFYSAMDEELKRKRIKYFNRRGVHVKVGDSELFETKKWVSSSSYLIDWMDRMYDGCEKGLLLKIF